MSQPTEYSHEDEARSRSSRWHRPTPWTSSRARCAQAAPRGASTTSAVPTRGCPGLTEEVDPDDPFVLGLSSSAAPRGGSARRARQGFTGPGSAGRPERGAWPAPSSRPRGLCERGRRGRVEHGGRLPREPQPVRPRSATTTRSSSRCSLGPGALTAGDVHIGAAAFIGAGAIVLPGVPHRSPRHRGRRRRGHQGRGGLRGGDRQPGDGRCLRANTSSPWRRTSVRTAERARLAGADRAGADRDGADPRDDPARAADARGDRQATSRLRQRSGSPRCTCTPVTPTGVPTWEREIYARIIGAVREAAPGRRHQRQHQRPHLVGAGEAGRRTGPRRRPQAGPRLADAVVAELHERRLGQRPRRDSRTGPDHARSRHRARARDLRPRDGQLRPRAAQGGVAAGPGRGQPVLRQRGRHAGHAARGRARRRSVCPRAPCGRAPGWATSSSRRSRWPSRPAAACGWGSRTASGSTGGGPVWRPTRCWWSACTRCSRSTTGP